MPPLALLGSDRTLFIFYPKPINTIRQNTPWLAQISTYHYHAIAYLCPPSNPTPGPWPCQ
jgi:hypothetical protein